MLQHVLYQYVAIGRLEKKLSALRKKTKFVLMQRKHQADVTVAS